jgi:hypothetical protein
MPILSVVIKPTHILIASRATIKTRAKTRTRNNGKDKEQLLSSYGNNPCLFPSCRGPLSLSLSLCFVFVFVFRLCFRRCFCLYLRLCFRLCLCLCLMPSLSCAVCVLSLSLCLSLAFLCCLCRNVLFLSGFVSSCCILSCVALSLLCV